MVKVKVCAGEECGVDEGEEEETVTVGGWGKWWGEGDWDLGGGWGCGATVAVC
ncbi:hypothetical protein BDFB_005943 [Asbolus verrucosus]|uniref:Uncharacterized protein n=1 Tax=Asbolus verrucosus TaxID=1661398 RepID=A0A482VGH3_ASBVE|nr:hypothetical protein BDFB_005943 [Asbolus verrucosus]